MRFLISRLGAMNPGRFSSTVNFNVTDALNFIDGNRMKAENARSTFPVYEPSTGTVLCECPESDKSVVDSAVHSAKSAFKQWSSLSGFERGRYLRQAGELIHAHLDEIAHLETKDNGKPLYESKMDIAGAADVFIYYGGLAADFVGDHIPLSNGNFCYTRREPLGVVAGIGAWNYPFQTVTWKCAPALAAGNTFVYKPSPLAPFTAVIMAEILTEAGIPKGVVNIIQGGKDTGEEICKHSDVAKVSFTGSVATGQRIMELCARHNLKRVTLELGGKSPLIIFEDCDMENAIKGAMAANFFTQGEVCSNGTRVFVHKSILKEFTSRLLERVKALKVGNPLDDDTRVGASISKEHVEKVLGYIQTAKDEKANILYGGEVVTPSDAKLAKGYYLSPCVIGDVTDDMTVAKEEIFGCVLSLMSFDTEEEVVTRANNTPFGLAAGLFTRNLQRAHRVAAQLEAGSISINNYNIVGPEIPFGGYKMSGFGRECGKASLENYTQVKAVYVEMGDVDSPF